MPISSEANLKGIPVKVYHKTGTVNLGHLTYLSDGPSLTIVNGENLYACDDVEFSLSEEMAMRTGIDPEDRVILDPIIVALLPYSTKKTTQFDMYPPSSDSWLTHVVDDGSSSVFTVQRIKGKEKSLLTIVDQNSQELYHIGLVRSYEPSILLMNSDWNVHNDIIYSDVPTHDIFSILDKESISSSTISKLVEGITIPNLTIQKSVRETLDQLVPHSFPTSVRNQIIAFLAWLDAADVPNEDPLDFIGMYHSLNVFRALIAGHIQCMVDNVEPPQYVRLLHMADRGDIQIAQRPYSEEAERSPWTSVKLKLHELFPNWTGRVIDHAIALQERRQVITELPVSREQARKSRKAWSDRFALDYHSLFMRGHVHKASIGLLPVIYVGAAHRWPHKHIEWSARLGYHSDKSQHVQAMAMPPSGFERISRVIPTVRLVDWEMSSFNLSLYSDKKRGWTIKQSLLTKSLERKRSITQLANEFGKWSGANLYKLTKLQAKILDLISWSLYIGELEIGKYSKYYEIDNSTIEQELSNMLDHGVFQLQYFLIPEKLKSLCIIADGPANRVCSMARAFLKHTPSTQVKITEKGTSCIIISRVPEDQHYDLASSLSDSAVDNDIVIRTYPIFAYAGYRNNLYSRLLKEDGTWDDDVSGLLSQIRLPSKNVS